MKLRNKLGYIALGGLLMLIGMLASSAFMPSLFADKDKFGEIECTKLTVIGGEVIVSGKDGKTKVLLGGTTSGGAVGVVGNDGKMKVSLGVMKRGGHAGVMGNDGKWKASLGVTELGNGAVSTWDKNGYRQ